MQVMQQPDQSRLVRADGDARALWPGLFDSQMKWALGVYFFFHMPTNNNLVGTNIIHLQVS